MTAERACPWPEHPEGPHSVENIDGHRFHAIRVEIKQPYEAPYQETAHRRQTGIKE
jgi:hypothetical protein